MLLRKLHLKSICTTSQTLACLTKIIYEINKRKIKNQNHICILHWKRFFIPLSIKKNQSSAKINIYKKILYLNIRIFLIETKNSILSTTHIRNRWNLRLQNDLMNKKHKRQPQQHKQYRRTGLALLKVRSLEIRYWLGSCSLVFGLIFV